MENKLKIDANTVVHCPTKELAKKVLKIAHNLGYKWCDGVSYMHVPNQNGYKTNTVYFLHKGTYADKEFALEHKYKVISAEEFINLHNMETRNISLTLEKAKEWYNSDSSDLKEVALQAYTEEELSNENFKEIKTFQDACKAIGISYLDFNKMLNGYYGYQIFNKTRASVAAIKLNIIRQALNKSKKTSLTTGTIYYPYNHFVSKKSTYYKDEICSGEMEVVAKFRVDGEEYTLLGGNAAFGGTAGLGSFGPNSGVANSFATVGFLGCASREIAEHMSRYFAKEIFEAKYGDLVNYKWI